VSEQLLITLGAVLFFLGCLSWFQPRVMNHVWHWHQTVSGLEESPDRFYAQIYQRLQDGVQVRQLPLSGLGFGPRHLFETRTILGGKPLYLEARYKHATLYLYIAATPAGLFISQWLFSKYTTWIDHPILKWFVLWYAYQQTLFQFDAVLMFGESVHAIVLDVLDTYIDQEGLKPLEEFERRPVLQSFYGSVAGSSPLPVGSRGGGKRLPL